MAKIVVIYILGDPYQTPPPLILTLKFTFTNKHTKKTFITMEKMHSAPIGKSERKTLNHYCQENKGDKQKTAKQ
jgi:hypothetical protein